MSTQCKNTFRKVYVFVCLSCKLPSLSCKKCYSSILQNIVFNLACVASVQSGGKGEVKFEREVPARSARSAIVGIWEGTEQFPSQIPAIAGASRSNLTSPFPPLCTPATQAIFNPYPFLSRVSYHVCRSLTSQYFVFFYLFYMYFMLPPYITASLSFRNSTLW